MKKTYVYFLVPLIGLIIFGAVYWNFSAGYEAKEAMKVNRAKKERQDKLLAEAKNREIAIADALKGQELRRKQKEQKDAKERADRDARELAIEAQRKAHDDETKFKKQVDRLKAEIKAENEAIAKLQEEKKKYESEEAFLRSYVKLAEANVKELMKVLDRIADADKKWAEAAKAAADAAKVKN